MRGGLANWYRGRSWKAVTGESAMRGRTLREARTRESCSRGRNRGTTGRGQAHPHGGAPVGGGVGDVDRSGVQPHGPAGNGQAQPGAARGGPSMLAGDVALLEAFENLGAVRSEERRVGKGCT